MSNMRSSHLMQRIEGEKYKVEAAGEVMEPGTFFVLRDTDLFGPAVLYGYVHLLQTQLELSRQRPGMLTPEEVEYLAALEGFVLDLAQEWQRRGAGRIPD